MLFTSVIVVRLRIIKLCTCQSMSLMRRPNDAVVLIELERVPQAELNRPWDGKALEACDRPDAAPSNPFCRRRPLVCIDSIDANGSIAISLSAFVAVQQ